MVVLILLTAALHVMLSPQHSNTSRCYFDLHVDSAVYNMHANKGPVYIPRHSSYAYEL